MAGAIRDLLDQCVAALPGCRRTGREAPVEIQPLSEPTVEDSAEGAHEVDVGALGLAAEVLGFARLASVQDALDTCAMVRNMQPVADIHAVAIDRQCAALKRTGEHQADQLFRERTWPVVVRAVADRRVQAVGVMIGVGEMIRRGLRRGVRGVRAVGRSLGERRVIRAKAALYLIGRDMVEAV